MCALECKRKFLRFFRPLFSPQRPQRSRREEEGSQINTDCHRFDSVNSSSRICLNPRQAAVGEGCCAICEQLISASSAVKPVGYGAAKPISIGSFGFPVLTITAFPGWTSTNLYVRLPSAVAIGNS